VSSDREASKLILRRRAAAQSCGRRSRVERAGAERERSKETGKGRGDNAQSSSKEPGVFTRKVPQPSWPIHFRNKSYDLFAYIRSARETSDIFDYAHRSGFRERKPAGIKSRKFMPLKRRETMNWLITILTKLGVLRRDLDYHLLRAAMVIVFLFFGYQKWFPYEAQGLIPYISHGPLIFWMYPVLGVRGAAYFLGARSGCSGCSCSRDSGTRSWEFLALWAGALALSQPPRSFRSFRMAGPLLPEDFPQ
jgi:Protein of unknown function, DUF417